MQSRGILWGMGALLLSLFGVVIWWFASNGQEWKSLSTGGSKVTQVCWLKNGEGIIGAVDNRLVSFAFPGCEKKLAVDLSDRVASMISTESGVLVALENGSIQLHDPATLEAGKNWTLPALGVVRAMALSANGAQVVLGGEKGVAFWNRSSMAISDPIKPVAKKIGSIAWNGTDSIVFTCNDSRLYIYSLTEGETRESKKLGSSLEVVVSDPQGRIVTGNKNGGIAFWKIGLEAPELSFESGGGSIFSISSSKGWFAAGGQDKQLHIFDISRKNAPVNLHGHRGRISQVAVHPDGQWIATASLDGTIKIWKAPS